LEGCCSRDPWGSGGEDDADAEGAALLHEGRYGALWWADWRGGGE
jgi:hypothetical protein